MDFFSQRFISENQSIELDLLSEKGIELYIKREDKTDPFVSGNKFRKLKYNIFKAKELGKSTLITFGGAFSNHIVATAVAGNKYGLKTIGFIRGNELAEQLDKILIENPTLKKAFENNMSFEFLSREQYRNKHQTEFLDFLKKNYSNAYIVPEGGTNHEAIKGCEEILTTEDQKFNYICSAVGTGGTISGIINSTSKNQKVIGFPALKGDFLNDEIKKYTQKTNWELNTDYNFGGYAKFNQELIRFINDFHQKTNIPLDPIYTGKMLFGIVDLIKKNHFKKGDKILAIHTGGLQGILGINQKLQKKNLELISV